MLTAIFGWKGNYVESTSYVALQRALGLFNSNRLNEASRYIRKALQLDPNNSLAWNLQAGILAGQANDARKQGKPAVKFAKQAETAIRAALHLSPTQGHMHYNLADLLYTHLGGVRARNEEAALHARAAVQLEGGADMASHLLLMRILTDSARTNLQSKDFELQVKEDLRQVLQLLRNRAASNSYPIGAKHHKMEFYDYWFPVVNFAMHVLHDYKLADKVCLEGAQAIDHNQSGEVYFFWATTVPETFMTSTDADAAIAQVLTRLEWLCAEAHAGRIRIDEKAGGPELLISPPSAYLGYFEGNHREIAVTASKTLRALAPSVLQWRNPHLTSHPNHLRLNQQLQGARVEACSRRKAGVGPHIGFLWGFDSNHAVSKAVDWLLFRLDPNRDKFETTLLLLEQYDKSGPGPDPRLFQASSRAIRLPRKPLPRLRSTIGDLRLDVLVFCELGLDPVRYALAFARMAPVQAVAVLGHPVTSGAAAIDYAVSNEVFEAPSDAGQDWFQERLIRLPGLPPIQESPAIPRTSEKLENKYDLLRRFGLWRLIDSDATNTFRLYVLPKNCRKLMPAFDKVLARILEMDPQGILILLAFSIKDNPSSVEALLRTRLQKSRVPCGSTAGPHSRCLIWAQRIPSIQFLAWLAHADALLETAPFSGFTTTLEGLQLGRPWIALQPKEGHSAGMMGTALLDMVGLRNCCVADNIEDYARKAVAMAQNRNNIQTLARAACVNNVSKLLLSGGNDSVRAWKQFLHIASEKAWARGRALRMTACKPQANARRAVKTWKSIQSKQVGARLQNRAQD